MSTSTWPLLEMTLPAPAAVPPIRLSGASSSTPMTLGSAAVPEAFVPIKLPCTMLLVAALPFKKTP